MTDLAIMTIAGLISCLPFILALFIFRKASKTIRYLAILSGMALLTELTGTYLAEQGKTNLFLFHFYPAIELLLFIAIYNQHFENPKAKRVLFIMGSFFVLFSLANTLFVQHINEFNTNGRAVESLLLSVLAIGYLISNIRSERGFNRRSKPMFWINTAVLLYFPLTMAFFSMNNYLIQNFSITFNNFLWDIHALLSFTQYILFTIAIYTEWKRTKSPALS